MSFAATKDVAVTTVVDSYTDVLAKPVPGVERHGPKKEPLLAEHGLSMHIRLGADKRDIAGCRIYEGALPYDLSRLEIGAARVDKMVISQGRRDHTAALA